MSEIIIYEPADGGHVTVRLEGESLWLTQEQIADVFKRERSVITKHLRNIFQDGELAEESNVQNLHIAGSDKPVKFYNLDAIISVGYRVNSKRGTQFRQWATGILRDHLMQGWTLDRARFEHNAAELEAALALVRKTAQSPDLIADTGRGLVEIVSRYTQTFLLLQRYDEGLLTDPNGTSGGVMSSLDEVRQSISSLKADLMSRGEASDLFGLERGDALAALLGNLDQSVFGEPAYPTIERKAAHLLYFVIKNHPLADGNKRTGAFLFVDFLNRNNALMRDGQPVINDIGLAALALLVAESAPAQKDTMIRLIENMLVGVR
ncbi:Fic family protein [Ferrovum myxofaciens]|uniref:Virulence RhuM family protein n=1 Tax=Ferrovum myxofaciens TaxID=416213 RepID=A0A9E6MX24_9PROT|nr:Fic family protein [Ferrovum myxofaciens]QKE38977.1 MAG: virulence RhuM family protein [Ferrovum myxofaciens]QWY74194.1 MAG: virulence RhuM family protein [Ferrovum myxofaciens]QWY76946.1 MAG: virulence RhuM family protein [Ferrovum myxofaciens]